MAIVATPNPEFKSKSATLSWKPAKVPDRGWVKIPKSYLTCIHRLNDVQHTALWLIAHDLRADSTLNPWWTVERVHKRLVRHGTIKSEDHIRRMLRRMADLGVLDQIMDGREAKYTLNFSSGIHRVRGHFVKFIVSRLDNHGLRLWAHLGLHGRATLHPGDLAKVLGCRWYKARQAINDLCRLKAATVVDDHLESLDYYPSPEDPDFIFPENYNVLGPTRTYTRGTRNLEGSKGVDDPVVDLEIQEPRSNLSVPQGRSAPPERGAARQTASCSQGAVSQKTVSDARALRSLRPERSAQHVRAIKETEIKNCREPWSAFDHQPLVSMDPKVLLSGCPWTSQIGPGQIDLLTELVDLKPQVFAQILKDMFAWVAARPDLMNRPFTMVLRWTRDPRNIRRAAKATGVSDPIQQGSPEFASEVRHLAEVQGEERQWLRLIHDTPLPPPQALAKFGDGAMRRALEHLIDLLGSRKSGGGVPLTRFISVLSSAIGREVECSMLGLAEAISCLDDDSRWRLTAT